MPKQTTDLLNSGPVLPLVWLPFILATFSSTTLAQNSQELTNLIFEPVLIETITLDENQEDELNNEDDTNIIVTELTSLPTSDHPTSASEYLVTQTILNEEETDVITQGSLEEYEARIRDLELQGGAYESALSQELIAMASLYQSIGEHETALEHLDQALHINRVNLGLYNLDQEAIINEQIKSHVALGDLEAADTQQEYLFFLKRRAYGGNSVEMLPALAQYAEWNIFAFDSRLANGTQLAFNTESEFYTNENIGDSFVEEDFKLIRLVNAYSIYKTMIQILLNNFGASDPRILEAEKRLALTNYFFATNLDINNSPFDNTNQATLLQNSQSYFDMPRMSTNFMGYRLGREALERRLEYMRHHEDIPAEDIVRAHVDLADWLMVFKKRTSSLEAYEEAYASAKENGVSLQIMNELFSPAIPQTIPTFVDYRYTRTDIGIPENQPLDYEGWLDVRMRLNRFGYPTDVDILGKSPNVTEPIENRLYRFLRNSSMFRPRFQDDALLDEDIYTVRYYFTY